MREQRTGGVKGKKDTAGVRVGGGGSVSYVERDERKTRKVEEKEEVEVEYEAEVEDVKD